jgi:HSP20 family protein
MTIDFSPFYDLPNYMDRFLEDLWRPSYSGGRRMSYPPVNVSEDAENMYVRAEVPGMSMNDLELTLAERSLVIRGDRRAEEGRYFRQERPAGAFQRVIGLNVPIERDEVKAVMRDGVLEVVLPKSRASGPMSIDIETE